MPSSSTADTAYLSLAELASLIRTRQMSPVEVTSSILDRIHRLDRSVQSFYTVFDEGATKAAKRAESEIAKGGYKGPLHGVPIGVKDVIDLGLTTAGSQSARRHRAKRPATAVRRIVEAGAVIIGKTATYEFACGRPTIDSVFPPARNPWNLDIDPGGSSSGSAAAVAAGLVYGALGTDSGGSIRYPAFACGITGLKPTYGCVSRAGVFPFSWSLDTVGPLARSAMDAAFILEACAGHDAADPTSTAVRSLDLTSQIAFGIKGVRIGIPRDFFEGSCDREILSAFDGAVRQIRSLGAKVRPVGFVSMDEGLASFWLQAAADVAAVHYKRFRRNPRGYGHYFRLLIEAGLLVAGWAYVDALRVRERIRASVIRLFDSVDLLMLPTVGKMPPRIDDHPGGYSTFTRGSTSYTFVFNQAGCPALAVPCGFSSGGLPIGLQFASRPWNEALLFRAAHALELISPWSGRHPLLNL